MKRMLLPVLVVGILLLTACGAPTTAPETEAPSIPKTEQPTSTTHILSINISPSGAGSVSPTGGRYQEGTQLTLTTTPASGYAFDYWGGDISGSSAVIMITMDSDKNVIANFIQITYDLTIGIVGNGITSLPAGVHSYPSGTEVGLTATPDEGWRFSSWSGDITDTSATISIVMDSDKTVVAHFADITPPVISNVVVSTVTDTKATVKWDTDDLATSQIEYGTTPAYGSSTPLDDKFTTSHSLALTELTPNTTYHFRVRSKDGAGNESISTDQSFVTSALVFTLLDLNTPYTAKSGLTVIVKSITKTQREGFKEYIISYTLKNNTEDQAIDEGTFKMFWVGGGGEPQYGFFGRLFPGESMTRSYTWKVLNSQQVLCIEFEADFFAQKPARDTLKWGVPSD